jgi:hypothetical protein
VVGQVFQPAGSGGFPTASSQMDLLWMGQAHHSGRAAGIFGRVVLLIYIDLDL